MTARRMALASAWIGVLLFLIGGGWALVAPRNFYDAVASYPPYNAHLFHDVGAFQLGIAAALAAGILGRRGLAVALWAGAVGATAHAIAHWMDVDLGGKSTDAPLLTVVALVLLTGLAAVESRRGVPR